MGGSGRAKLVGLNLGHRDALHPGEDETKIEHLAIIEKTERQHLSRILTTMRQVKEGKASLRTALPSWTSVSSAMSRPTPVTRISGIRGRH